MSRLPFPWRATAASGRRATLACAGARRQEDTGKADVERGRSVPAPPSCRIRAGCAAGVRQDHPVRWKTSGVQPGGGCAAAVGCGLPLRQASLHPGSGCLPGRWVRPGMLPGCREAYGCLGVRTPALHGMPSSPGRAPRSVGDGALARAHGQSGTAHPASPAADTKPFHLFKGDVQAAYPEWPSPRTIISDGAYGVRGFHGDTADPTGLVGWYRAHIEAWTRAAEPGTTLWFWGTEVGWATVHAELDRQGWDYVQTIIWDKGLSHIAGHVNSQTIRQFPVVTEVCALYMRRFELAADTGMLGAQEWLRHEWQRSGLALSLANHACGVRSAATRKYLTTDRLWYFPPGVMVARMAAYCNEHGLASGRPYFSVDGQRSVGADEWDGMRYPWTHTHGLTNVWARPPLHDRERHKGSLRRSAPRTYQPTRASATHLNQKPLEFMERLLRASTREGDVVWEPFGGLASASVAAVTLGRTAFVAEWDPHFADIAEARLSDAAAHRATSTGVL